MPGIPGILFSYALDGAEKAHTLSGEAISREVKAKTLAWVHLDGSSPDAKAWVEREVAYLDHLILSALFASETRPRMFEHGEGILLILRGMNLNENADPEDMVPVRLWVDPNRVISIQDLNLRAVGDLRRELDEGCGPRTAGQFVAALLANLCVRMEPTLAKLDEATDLIEQRVIHMPSVSERLEIVDIRTKAILFRRYLAPQRDVIAQLQLSRLKWLSEEDRRSLRESHNRLMRYLEDLDAIRERAQIIKDELANTLADRLNHNLYVLSVIAAVFLPLGFSTGLFGINIGGMPGVDDPYAFTIFSVSLIVLVILQIIIFKKLKWF